VRRRRHRGGRAVNARRPRHDDIADASPQADPNNLDIIVDMGTGL
jgi:hypothetical protein